MIDRASAIVAALALLAFCALGLVRATNASTVDAAIPSTPRVDVNSACADTLDLLPRIGPALSQRIIDDREEHGPFDDLDDLERVPGIGPKTVEGLRPFGIAR